MDNTQNSTKDHLLNLARAAQQNAYARYSNFRVGAAILLENGEIFTGCNVENASYGLTNCAERSAIFAAVSRLGAANVKIRAVAVVNDHDMPCSPCGACRQVIAEFGPDTIIWYQGQNGIKESTIHQLLPESFTL
jgi:cytidine deaminase